MALISMATLCTEDNNRAEYLAKVLQNLHDTVDLTKHRIFLIDNSPGDIAKEVYKASPLFKQIEYKSNGGKNYGTAEAVNMGWWKAQPREHCIKMDDDCIIHSAGWVDEMEEAIEREPTIGILGLKRKDLEERPDHEASFFRSRLHMLPHEKGQRWIIVEYVEHVMGTCQMYNWRLREKFGYLYQPGLYGYDDSIAAVRCTKAGFHNAFLTHIHIDHIDPGNTEYQKWKESKAQQDGPAFQQLKAEYMNGNRSVYYVPNNPY